MNMQFDTEKLKRFVLWMDMIAVIMLSVIVIMIMVTKLDEINLRKEVTRLELAKKQTELETVQIIKDTEKAKRDFWEKPDIAY